MLKLWIHLFLLAIFGALYGSQQATAISINIADISKIDHKKSLVKLSDFTCPGSDGFFPSDDVYCSQTYYYCLDGTAYEQICSGVNVYDPIKQQCLPLSEASCQDPAETSTQTPTPTPTPAQTQTQTPTPTSTSTAGTTPSYGDSRCYTPDGFFAFPGFCSRDYIICVNGTVYQDACAGQGNPVFDPVLLVCVPYEEATCNTENFVCTTSDGVFPLTPDACSPTFMSCIHFEAFLGACTTPKVVFDPESFTCEFIENSSCWH